MRRLLRDPIFLLLVLTVVALFLFRPLRFCLPVVLGALIGYITNVLAVWMIFNPKRPILGYVGVLPRRKRDIALRLGEMIERELVNPESILRLLQSRKREIEEAVARAFLSVFEGEDRSFMEILGDRYPAFRSFLLGMYERHLDDLTPLLSSLLRDSLPTDRLLSDLYSRISGESLIRLFPEAENLLWEGITYAVRRLREPEVAWKVAEVLDRAMVESQRGRIEGAILNLINAVSGGYSRRKVEELIKALPDLLDRDPDFREGLRGVLRSLLNRPIREVTTRESFVRVGRAVVSVMLDYASEGATLRRVLGSALVREGVAAALDSLLALSPARIVRKVGRERFKVMVEEVVEGSFPLLRPFLEAVVRKVDVKRIVVERVEAYSVEEVEELVFGVMGKEFRFIEYMGIPIGAVVGGLQLLVMLLK